MSWVRVSREEMDRIRKLAADRKAKRAEKRKTLPWGRQPVAVILPAINDIKPKKKRRKKTPVEIAWDRNDALWSLAVRQRDGRIYGNRCRLCGQKRPLVGYHLVPKKRGAAIRWLLENGVQGCSPCNFGERMNPSKYREKHVALVGAARIEAIEALAHIKAQFDLTDLLAIGAWLKAVIEAGPGQPPPSPPPCLPPLVYS